MLSGVIVQTQQRTQNRWSIIIIIIIIIILEPKTGDP